MKVKIVEQDGITIATVDGNIPQESVTVFRNRISDLIENKKNKIVLSLIQSNYISSMCLAVIIDAKNKLGQIHGDIKVVLGNSLIRSLFEMTNLVKKIEVFETVEDAVESFKSKRPHSHS